MRLIEVYSKLKNIDFPQPVYDITKEERFRYNYKQFRLIEAQLNINFSKTPNIDSTLKYIGALAKMSYSPEVTNEIKVISGELVVVLRLLEGVLGKNLYQNENTINIKLQDTIGTFKSLNETIASFNVIFQKISLTDYEIIGLDKGSNWIEININTKSATLFLLALILGAMQIRKSYYEGSYYKTLQEKETLELTIKKAQQYDASEDTNYKDRNIRRIMAIKDDFDDIINDIVNKNPEHSKKINGTSKAINDAIIEISKLMDNGIEIHPSLNPPEWLKEDENGKKFIDYNSVKKIEKPQKQIENKQKE